MFKDQESQLQQSEPLVVPLGPALYSLDASSWKFGSHYTMFQFGVSGYNSSDTVDMSHDNRMMSNMNGAVNKYNQQASFAHADQNNAEWHDSHPRQESAYVHTPNASLGHDFYSLRNDGLTGQRPGSTATPTDRTSNTLQPSTNCSAQTDPQPQQSSR
jgi:hypothetical protein